MKARLLCFLLIFFWKPAVAGSTRSAEAAEAGISVNLSTPIRVLLQRDRTYAAVQSPKNRLYAKAPRGLWKPMNGAKLHVELRNGHPFLLVNDVIWTDVSVYFRGG